MKHIYFLRHAKAASDIELKDMERPLSAEGELQAATLARHALKHIKAPEVIITSSASRALQTALYLKEAWRMANENLLITPNLYTFGKEGVLDFIYGMDDEYKQVMLVGHNFAFSDVVSYTANERVGILPTAGFVEVRYDVKHWYQVAKGEVVNTVFPLDLIDEK